MRIGTNHGSLSDRIMSRYGDTPIGMVESAMEFLRIARDENYHQIILSMKASNPQVMVQAYRLLIQQMDEEFGAIYPLHLGVTEAGDGEEGRIKSAVGIGTLLEDGIGDTIRVSLTEDPELEIPVCRDLVKRYLPPAHPGQDLSAVVVPAPEAWKTSYQPFQFKRHATQAVSNIGGGQVPVVIADFSQLSHITPQTLERVGYIYNETDDKWNIADTAADYIYLKQPTVDFALPGTLKIILPYSTWLGTSDPAKYMPLYPAAAFMTTIEPKGAIHFVMIDCPWDAGYVAAVAARPNTVLCLSSTQPNAMQTVRAQCIALKQQHITAPIVLMTDSNWQTADEHLIHFATETGALFLDGFGDGICLGMTAAAYEQFNDTTLGGRRYSSLSENQP